MAVRNSYSGSLLDNPDDPNAIDPALVMNTPIPGAPASPMGGSSNGLPTSNDLPVPGDTTLSTTPPAASTMPASPTTADPSLLGPNYSGPLPASFGGKPTSADQVPVPSVNPGVVYTDASGQGYTPDQLYANRNTLLQDPANARVRDLLTQYGYGAPAASASASGSPVSLTSLPGGSFSPSAGFALPETGLGESTSGGIQSLIANHGATPEETSLLDRVNQIIANGGALPGDTTLEQQQLESARENESHAFGAQLSDARDELANRGLVGEPGAPQGAEGEAIDTISRNLAPSYAQSVRDIKSQQIQTQNARLTSAIQTATGLDENAANNLVAGLGEGTQRQVALSQIALDSLSQNTQWNEFLATYGLNRDQVLNSIQSGNTSSLMTLLSLFEQMTGLASAGHI